MFVAIFGEMKGLRKNMIRGYIKRISGFLSKKQYYCTMCKKGVPYWDLFGSDSDIYNKVHIVGGGKRECQCPYCGSIDRGRWVDYVLEKYTAAYKNNDLHILHIAPEVGIPEKMREIANNSYVTADLQMKGVDVFFDVVDIPFRDGWFDIVIMNHVLSYIEDEERAMKELLRVMKSSGILIISFPICMEYECTIEKRGLDTHVSFEEFGTEGNCRMYGADFVSRMEKYGIYVNVLSPSEILDEKTINFYGFLSDDIVLLCKLKG